MAKTITYIITFAIIFLLIPYVAYNAYYDHQDGIYKTLEEYDSYTTVDNSYSLKVMKYKGIHGEEVYTFKVYLYDKKEDKAYFIKNIKVSSNGTEVDFNDDVALHGKLSATISGGSDKYLVEVDVKTKTPPGKKLRIGIV